MTWRGHDHLRWPADPKHELTPQEVGALQSAGKDRETFLRRNGLWPKEETDTGRMTVALTKIVRGEALTWGDITCLQAAARDRETYRRITKLWDDAWETTELIESGLRKLRADFYARSS